MRQKSDMQFAELPNRLRHNKLTEGDRESLKCCEITSNDVNYQLNALHLFAENYFMHMFNDVIISNMETEKVSIPCYDSVVSQTYQKTKKKKQLKEYQQIPVKLQIFIAH